MELLSNFNGNRDLSRSQRDQEMRGTSLRTWNFIIIRCGEINLARYRSKTRNPTDIRFNVCFGEAWRSTVNILLSSYYLNIYNVSLFINVKWICTYKDLQSQTWFFIRKIIRIQILTNSYSVPNLRGQRKKNRAKIFPYQSMYIKNNNKKYKQKSVQRWRMRILSESIKRAVKMLSLACV